MPGGSGHLTDSSNQLDPATVQFHDPSRNREPKTTVGPCGRAVTLPEPLEQMRHEFFSNADPGVADRELHMRVDALQTQLNPPATWRELDGVRQQVPDHLLQSIRIARYASDVRLHH